MRTTVDFSLSEKTKFQKLPLSIDKQINLLKQRGLVIDDKNYAYHFLQYVSY